MAQFQQYDRGGVLAIIIRDTATKTVVNLTGALTAALVFRKPSGKTFQRNAINGGSNGKLSYTWQVNELDESGEWEVQAFVRLASGAWYSSTATFQVGANITVAQE